MFWARSFNDDFESDIQKAIALSNDSYAVEKAADEFEEEVIALSKASYAAEQAAREEEERRMKQLRLEEERNRQLLNSYLSDDEDDDMKLAITMSNISLQEEKNRHKKYYNVLHPDERWILDKYGNLCWLRILLGALEARGQTNVRVWSRISVLLEGRFELGEQLPINDLWRILSQFNIKLFVDEPVPNIYGKWGTTTNYIGAGPLLETHYLRFDHFDFSGDLHGGHYELVKR